MNERTNVLCMCVRGTLFLIGDDETERDRQLIGYNMNHSIQVSDGGVITENNNKIFTGKQNEL